MVLLSLFSIIVRFRMHTLPAGEFFAVKELPIERTGQGDQNAVVNDLMKEIGLLASLEHRHIVRYIGTQRSPDRLFLFTEYVTGSCSSSVRIPREHRVARHQLVGVGSLPSTLFLSQTFLCHPRLCIFSPQLFRYLASLTCFCLQAVLCTASYRNLVAWRKK